MKYLFLCLSLLFITAGHAQKKPTSVPPKKALDHSVYDSWKEITYKELTPDGTSAVFTINPQDGDGKVVFYNLKSNTQDSIHRASDIALTFDSKFAVFKIKPQQKVVKELRRQKKKKEDLPKDSLGIYSFQTRKTEKLANIKSYQIPEKASGWLAYQKDVKKEDPKTNSDTGSKAKKAKKNNEENGYTLVLRKLADGKEQTFEFVKEYQFAKYGQGLLFSTTGNDSTLTAGVYWYDLKNESLNAIHQGHPKYKYKALAISEAGDQAAFLLDSDTTKALIRSFKLFQWKTGSPSAQLLDVANNPAFPQDWLVSEYYTPRFSKNGTKLFFGSAPKPFVQDTTLLPEEIVNVEVWHSEDDYIYPQQNAQLNAEKKRTYLNAISLETNTMVSLGSKDIPTVSLGDEGDANVLLGETNVPYRKAITWEGGTAQDIYLFNLTDKSNKKIATAVRGNASFSPKANYVYWFNEIDTAWFSYNVKSGKTVKLNQNLKVLFADEQDDHPDYPNRYGAAGWTANDDRFIAYDRYDLWSFDPNNNSDPVNLTKIGRSQKIVFRYVKLDEEERFIDPNKELLLSAFDETTKASGYYTLTLKNGKLTKRLMDNYSFDDVKKAKQSNQLLFTRENFREFPDVWTTADVNFGSIKKISDANPQMKNYLWGNIELVNWTSLDNIPLSGLLIKPENFDPSKKYPMMVYFYERMSDGLHRHIAPAPIRSSINFSLYASNGYLVFVPDIVYKIGYPGESALNCILPGITDLMKKGFVDEKNIGVQGHSWGGYQIAYLVTRTNIFKAAEAGAPVVNMTSAYGGIRWGSGLSRMFQYERTQTRLGGSLWDKPLRFIENSPLFFADKIETPVLMMHNDADGAVPWYQGIEFYMALRRLNKPVWMLNYNNEDHGLKLRQNKTDFAIRMMQYFDHYLKGTEKPRWMEEGIPAIEKGINNGY